MSRTSWTTFAPRDYVWFAQTWHRPVVVHDRGDREDREIEHADRVGVLAGWNFTRCGLLITTPIWEPGWSDGNSPPRFAAGASRGYDLPLGLLNPQLVRPCRRCFDVAGGDA